MTNTANSNINIIVKKNGISYNQINFQSYRPAHVKQLIQINTTVGVLAKSPPLLLLGQLLFICLEMGRNDNSIKFAHIHTVTHTHTHNNRATHTPSLCKSDENQVQNLMTVFIHTFRTFILVKLCSHTCRSLIVILIHVVMTDSESKMQNEFQSVNSSVKSPSFFFCVTMLQKCFSDSIVSNEW